MLSRLSFDAVIETVLVKTDAPEIVLVRDHFDGIYLCALVQIERDNYFYMGVPVSSARLSDLRTGKMDLREALAEPEEKLYVTGRLKLDASTPTITLKAEDGLDLDWLPESGFLLSDFKPSSDESVVAKPVPQ